MRLTEASEITHSEVCECSSDTFLSLKINGFNASIKSDIYLSMMVTPSRNTARKVYSPMVQL